MNSKTPVFVLVAALVLFGPCASMSNPDDTARTVLLSKLRVIAGCPEVCIDDKQAARKMCREAPPCRARVDRCVGEDGTAKRRFVCKLPRPTPVVEVSPSPSTSPTPMPCTCDGFDLEFGSDKGDGPVEIDMKDKVLKAISLRSNGKRSKISGITIAYEGGTKTIGKETGGGLSSINVLGQKIKQITGYTRGVGGIVSGIMVETSSSSTIIEGKSTRTAITYVRPADKCLSKVKGYMNKKGNLIKLCFLFE